MFGAILRKELLSYFQDRGMLLQLLLSPLITISLFSFLLANPGLDGLRVAVVAPEGSERSAVVAERLTAANLAPEVMTEAAFDWAITRGELLAGVVLPEGDEAARLYLSPAQSGVAKALGRQVEAALAEAGASPGQVSAGSSESTGQISATPPGAGLPAAVVVSHPVELNWGTPAQAAEPANTGAAGYIILTLFFIVVNVGQVLVKEQTAGVFRRLQGTPLTGWALFLGKWLPAWLISLLQAVLFIGWGALILDLDLGPLTRLGPVILIVTACATALGLWVGSFAKTEAQVPAIGVSLSLALAALGGCFAPLYLLPKWLQYASWAIPQHWALVAVQQGIAATGTDIAVVLPYIGILTVFTLIFALLGSRRFGLVLRRR
ncbi:MAG TPA: ABC transporter permease [Symbiobacteriaceae bacterium]|nr:ABC transporter permease [Symbiobacteriaceae bacterium]